MRIGELAAASGVSERALRHYEDRGLLHPIRASNGYRRYDEADVATVRHIRTLLAAGLNLSTIAEVLPCMVDDGERLRAMDCPELLEMLAAEAACLDRRIAEMRETRAALGTIIDAPAAAC